MENNEKSIYINGPENVIRLEGSIHNIKKIIYVFMDIHNDVKEQTQCKSLYNIDFHKYIINILPLIKHKIDIFLEITQFEIKQDELESNINKKIHVRSSYLNEFSDYFKSEYKLKKNDNVRFHYIDIRDFFYMEIIYLCFKLTDYSSRMWNDFFLSYDMIDDSLNILNKMEEKIKYIYEMFQKNEFNEKNKTNTDIFFYKIKKKYNHDNVKNIINNFINQYIIKSFDILFDQIREYKEILEYIKKKYKNSHELFIADKDDLLIDKYKYVYFGFPLNIVRYCIKRNYFKSNIIRELVLSISVFIMDIYFIRRFLDKDYITNGIVYTGSEHSLTYIFILVKYFGFKITNYSYINELVKNYNIDKLNKEIQYKKHPSELRNIFLKKYNNQCIDLGSFPKNFE